MLFSAIVLAGAAITPAALAAPSGSTAFTKRNEPFSCANAYNSCVSQENASVEICQQNQDACNTCVANEAACREGADYSKQLQCTVEAQNCLFQAEGTGTLNGAYSCEESEATCKAAPMENNAFCASQNSGCLACRDQENKCRVAPEANQSFCASQVSGCYAKVASL